MPIARSTAPLALGAYGGVFVAGSLLWGAVADGYRPDRWDIAGMLIRRAGTAVIMWAPRSGRPAARANAPAPDAPAYPDRAR